MGTSGNLHTFDSFYGVFNPGYYRADTFYTSNPGGESITAYSPVTLVFGIFLCLVAFLESLGVFHLYTDFGIPLNIITFTKLIPALLLVMFMKVLLVMHILVLEHIVYQFIDFIMLNW